MRNSPALRCFLALAATAVATSSVLAADEIPVVRSAKSGVWSAKETWDQGRVPKAGDRVVVRGGHHVVYDVASEEVIRLVQIAGTLEFARDRSTRLDAGLITIINNEEPSEEGFDCHAPMTSMKEMKDAPESARPSLLVGRPGQPIPEPFSAVIRLHYIEGMDRASCPAIVCCGGRMEFHGEPIQQTWLKLRRTAEAGSNNLYVDEWAGGWKQGDHVIVTSTHRQRGGRGGGGDDFLARTQTEERRIVGLSPRDFTGGYSIRFDRPLAFSHFAEGNFRGEIANLTRNVVVESANPDGVRGHTMYHRGSAGSISYAEFRHLGKEGEKGRYSIHFHLVGETMRGSSVIGASVWDSKNRWITIHGTDALVVRDVVGYRSVGHGFFLESGSEVNNILDHNLAALVLPGKPQKEQEVPFDLNRGAGFWWANSQNSFTRNVAADCAEYGYRFDVKKTADYDPVRPIRQPDGSTEPKDVRTLPFVRFEDNEAHTMNFFCLNLRGVTRPDQGLDFYSQNESLASEAAAARPEPGHPFWIRDFRCWEANWATHLGTTGVFIDGLDVFRADVAIWRSIMDGSGFRRMTTKDMRVNDIHNPLSSGYVPSRGDADRGAFRGLSSFKDDMPPTTVITSAVREGNLVRLRGSVADASDIKRVLVNGREATSTRGAFAEWETVLEASSGAALDVAAAAEDVLGHVEPRPHVVRVEASGL